MSVDLGGERRRDVASGWRRAVPALLVVVGLAAYGRAAARGFTSEDFLLVRHLGEHPPWRDLVALLTGPWLGITAVGFWRPVATLLYGLEIAAFGAWTPGYNVAHTLVHAANAGLVWVILRRLLLSAGSGERDVAALAGALLFLLHPLHPNAVLFGASFATLFAASFALAAVALFLEFRQSGSWWSCAGAAAAYALALGSYEGAAVLPAILLAAVALVGAPAGGGRRDRRRAAVAGLALVAFLAVYLGWRLRIFGALLAGYAETSERLLVPDLGRAAVDLVTSVRLLHLPLYDPWPTPLAAVAVAVLLLGGGLALCLAARRRRGGSPVRLWLLAWVWILAAQLPFAFRPAVPANGRYWYLAAAGVALEIAVLARAAAALAGVRWGRAVWAAVGAWAAVWAVLLQLHVGHMLEAARLARRVQEEVRRAADAAGGPVFVTRHPDFLFDSRGTPLAQVLRYGLRDALGPPFADRALDVYPLPPLAGAELVPVALGASGREILEWSAEAEEARAAAVPPEALAGTELQVVSPADGAVVAPSAEIVVEVPSGPHAAFRLLVSSRGNGAVFELPSQTLRGGVLRAGLPRPFLQTMERLYGPGEHYWWVEARDSGGRLSGFTRLRSLRLRSR